MDLDSLITFIMLLVFFVLPSIFKQLAARKKKAPATQPQGQKKKNSWFTRIGDQIRQFLKELEQQARQAKKQQAQGEPVGPDQDFWDSLSGDDPPDEGYVARQSPEVEPEPSRAAELFTPEPEPPEIMRESIEASSSRDMGAGKRKTRSKGRFKRHPLQNAVVWSEILSKPVALRENSPMK